MSLTITDKTEMTPDKARRWSRARYNHAMKLVRRAHLYAGLFMTPWVFLYGGTALLFNHPSAFPDQEVRTIAPKDLAGTPLADFPKPAELASRVVEAINASSADDEGPTPTYELIRPEEASYGRDYVAILSGEGFDHTVRLDLVSGSGTVRSGPRRTEPAREPAAPFAGRVRLKLETQPVERLNRSLPEVLARLGLKGEIRPVQADPGGGRERGTREGEGGGRRREGGRLPEGEIDAERGGEQVSPGGRGGAMGPQGRMAGLAGPELTFFVEGAGKVWRSSYNLQTASLTGRPADEARPESELSTRRFLTRLHMAHGYPSRIDARWVWAIAVDLMFVSMVGWGITGLLMWWQMKNMRQIGTIVLVLSAVVSAAVGIGMHSSMVGGP